MTEQMTDAYFGKFNREYGDRKPKIFPNDEYHTLPKVEIPVEPPKGSKRLLPPQGECG